LILLKVFLPNEYLHHRFALSATNENLWHSGVDRFGSLSLLISVSLEYC